MTGRRVLRLGVLAAGLAAGGLLIAPAVALASGGSHFVLAPAFLGPIGHAIGSVWHAVTGVVLGALNWTVGVAAKFILNTLGGLIRLLIPRSWASDGLQVMHWIVAVPDYAGTITSPGGHTVYGFGGINALRDLFMWTGAALLPLTLVYATSRAALGGGGHVAAPIGRVVALAALLVSYPWWWSQGAALVNQLSHFVLALPPVTNGVYRLMQYAVGGVALGGWQLIDLALMGAIGVALLGLIFLKVVIVLLGALIYTTGPLMIALIPTEGGIVVARAWASAAVVLIVLPLAWSAILAVGALLINDSSTAGPLIAGHGTIATLLGGLLLAFAGLAALWLCIRTAREAGGVVRGQLGGALVIGRGARSHTASAQPAAPRRASESLRSFGGRVAGASGAAFRAAGPAGEAVASGAGQVAHQTRGGLIGMAAGAARVGSRRAGPGTAALVGRTRAGAVAVRMAKAGGEGWQRGPRSGQPRAAGRQGAPAAREEPQVHAAASATPPREQAKSRPAPPPTVRRTSRSSDPGSRPGATPGSGSPGEAAAPQGPKGGAARGGPQRGSARGAARRGGRRKPRGKRA
jgi:hypothetical protein